MDWDLPTHAIWDQWVLYLSFDVEERVKKQYKKHTRCDAWEFSDTETMSYDQRS